MIQEQYAGEIPIVSIIVPCRNEELYIEDCLKSIVEQSYPKDKLEVIVVDGLSIDKTRNIVERYARQFDFIKLFNNEKKITPTALNKGIKHSNGKFILWMSAHNAYDKNYVTRCLESAMKYGVENIGGVIKTIPRGKNLMAEAICTVLSNRFGIGNSVFKTGSTKPKIVDTVFGGCYRREVFDKIGTFNEKLVRGQDMEFNLRLKKAGMKTLLIPDIVSFYYARSSFVPFIKHNFLNGVWAILPFKYTKNVPVSLRHLVPLAFVLGLVLILTSSFVNIFFLMPLYIILGTYIVLDILFSFKEAISKRKISIFFFLFFLFPILHISYGAGSIWGLLRCLISRDFWLNIIAMTKSSA